MIKKTNTSSAGSLAARLSSSAGPLAARIILAALLAPAILLAQSAQLRWDTQLDRPVDHPLIIYRGETLDLLPRLVQGTDPVTITNQHIYFRYREPALIASNLYREVPITTNSSPGTLQFTWTPELDILSPTYDYEFVVGSNPRIHGRITMRGTISHMASTNAPPPSTRWITDIDLAAATNGFLRITDIPPPTDTLATVAARGGFDGTETIGPRQVNSQRIGPYAGDNASGDDWMALGNFAGNESSGSKWLALGFASAYQAIGNQWTAIGNGAGEGADGNNWTAVGFQSGWRSSGSYWSAFGRNAGSNAKWTNSVALGSYAGWYAKGNNRLYIDVYSDRPSVNMSPTNNMIFGDDGQLNLGRVGRPLSATPNRLRGKWELDDGTQLEQLATKDYVDSQPKGPTNAVYGFTLYDTGSNIWTTVIMSNGFLSVWEIINE